MPVVLVNNFASTLAADITSTGQASLTVASGAGALLPTLATANDWTPIVVSPIAGDGNETAREIMRLTGPRTGTEDVIGGGTTARGTLTRAQEGTAAATWSTGALVQVRPTAAALQSLGFPANTNVTSSTTTASVTTTETLLGTVTITPSSATARVQVYGRADFTKGTGTTVATGTVRVRRSTTGTPTTSDPQVGVDAVAAQSATASAAMGPAIVMTVDQPNTTSAVTYGVFAVSTGQTISAPRHAINAVEVAAQGPQGAAGPTGPSGATTGPVPLVLEFGDAVNDLAANMTTGAVRIPSGMTLTVTRWDIAADVSGSAVVGVQSSANGTSWSSIAASAKPTLSSAQVASNTTLTGWTTTLVGPTWVRGILESFATVKKVTVTLGCVRS